MKKEEILEMSRNEKNDEMEKQIRDKSMRWTYLALVLSAAVFAFYRSAHGQPFMDLSATVCFSVFAGRLYCYLRARQTFDLVMAAVTLVMAVFATVRYFMGH